jgi:hypothetical protein
LTIDCEDWAEKMKSAYGRDAARERLAQRALADWSEQDLKDLTRLLRRFTDNLMQRDAP